MIRRLSLLSVSALILFMLSTAPAAAQPPRLVVVVTVDQLPFSYFERFHRNLDPNGLFARIARDGVSYSDCKYDHACTYTGPGHATISTGAYPEIHGIIDNSWYDRGTKAVINCVADPTVEVVGATSGSGASPVNLLVPTLGDALKLAYGEQAKVFSIGVKDRAAILTAGRLADGVFWMNDLGGWVTSSAYGKSIPGYLRQLSEAKAADQFAGQEWTLLYPAARYQQHRDDNDALETPSYGMTAEFPHQLPAADDSQYYSRMKSSPFCNQYVLASATTILEDEQLGRDDTPDLLFVNLSSNDYVGHSFGPYSLEVEDMFYRTDLQLGAFAEVLDSQVGRGNWTLAFSSDHGVAPNPQYAERLGLLAKAKPLGDSSRVKALLESQLEIRFGILDDDDPSYVESVRPTQIYLRETHPNLIGDRFAEAQRMVRTLLLAHPSVAAAYTREELISGEGHGSLRTLIGRAFHPDRSGDVAFALGPYQYDNGSMTASHGSPWRYDRHVPLMLLGRGVKRGEANRPVVPSRSVDPSSLAPTLSRILAMPAPAAAHSGPLNEAFDD